MYCCTIACLTYIDLVSLLSKRIYVCSSIHFCVVNTWQLDLTYLYKKRCKCNNVSRLSAWNCVHMHGIFVWSRVFLCLTWWVVYDAVVYTIVFVLYFVCIVTWCFNFNEGNLRVFQFLFILCTLSVFLLYIYLCHSFFTT